MRSRSDKLDSRYSERTNHTSSTVIRHNLSQNSLRYATHYSTSPVPARTYRNQQGNGDYVSLHNNSSAFEGIKKHYADKMYELQLEKYDMKIAFAKTTKENQDMKKLIQIRSAQHDHDRKTLENYERDVEKYKRDAVKKDRAHDVLSYQLDDTLHKLDRMKKDSNINTKAFNSEIEQLEKLNYDLKKRIGNEIDNSKLALAEYETLKQDIHSTDNEMKCCKTKLRKCQADLQSERENKAELKKTNSQLNAEMCELKGRIEHDKNERSSKCVGDTLSDNNPNIVELSDMNRPSKLAVRYKDLYDNEWTDAYEILEDTESEEEQIITILLTILIETKRFCDEENRIQMGKILSAITHSDTVHMEDIPVGVFKYIMDCRKSSSAHAIRIKYEKYMSETKKGSIVFPQQALAVNEYLKECFEICWLMSIQDPPVVVSPLLKHGVSFRTDLYCDYTVSGKLVDYIVWPALLLHENGPTLAKGVAQGMKRA